MNIENSQYGFTTTFSGRLGNHMYQYAYVRLLAEEENRPFQLKSDLIKKHFGLPKESLLSATAYKRADGFPFYQADKYLDLIYKNRKKVVSWFKPSVYGMLLLKEKNFPPVVNVRGGDFLSVGRSLNFQYYYKTVARLKKDPIIITDDCEYARSIFSSNEILHTSDDFSVLYHAKELVCSSSTYCWWAAFLGEHDLLVSPDERWATLSKPLSPFIWGIQNMGWMFLDSDGQIKQKMKGTQ